MQQAQKTLAWELTLPGACKFRVHFTRLEIDHFGDSLTIKNGAGEVVEFINKVHAAGWSDVIDGDRATLVLEAGDYVNAFGFAIDRWQWLP